MDPSSARASPGISCVQMRHRHRSDRNPCTRASQTVRSTHACTAHPHLHTKLRQGHQGGLHGSRWRADGDLRWVANRVSTAGSGQRAWAWACERIAIPARAMLLSPCGKILRARLRGRDPSTGWAGPCAAERTASRVRRAQSATPKMKATRPSRARCSHGLRKRTRPSQLMILITTICICRAGVGGSTNALTF